MNETAWQYIFCDYFRHYVGLTPMAYRGMRIVYKYDDGFHDDFKAAIKQEQNQACLDSAEREQFRTEFNVCEELKIEYYD